ncbi:MAG TPA: hypothetical protein VMS84_07445 [Mycobacterium sp.]|nr:hypothetical protein [Mycobacterium sp.]
MTAHPTTRNGTASAAKIAELEGQVALLNWCVAEQRQQIIRMGMTLAAMLAQQMQPQMQQTVLNQLLGNTPQ